jgi:hypothetical protein
MAVFGLFCRILGRKQRVHLQNNRESSGSGIAENARDFAGNLLVRPIRVLGAQPSFLHFARRPLKSFRQSQAAFRSHTTENGNLFRVGLLVQQH